MEESESISVTRFASDNVAAMPDLVTRMEAVNAKIHTAPRSFRHDILPRTSDAFVAWRGDELAGFVFTQRGTLMVNGLNRQALRFGPAAVAKAHRRRGVMKQLLAAVSENERSRVNVGATEPVMWGVTANPITYLAAERVFAELVPQRRGGYSVDDLDFTQAIKRLFPNVTTKPTMHPFFLPGAVGGRRYLPEDAEEMRLARAAAGLAIFDLMKLDPEKGDRMIMLFQLRA
jgi:GNAT superfamily N-acetyltransferase